MVYPPKSRVMVWRAARCLMSCDRLLSPLSVILLQLRVVRNEMRWAIVDVVIVYLLKSRMMVWRAARCLRPCDRLSSPPLVTLLHLRVRRNQTSNCCHYSYFLKLIWSSFTIFNPFRLSFTSFISFLVTILLCFTFINLHSWTLTYSLQRIALFLRTASSFLSFSVTPKLQISNSFSNHNGITFLLPSIRKTPTLSQPLLFSLFCIICWAYYCCGIWKFHLLRGLWGK